MSPEKKAVVAGLQFGFDLPYRGYLNVSAALLSGVEPQHLCLSELCRLRTAWKSALRRAAAGRSDRDARRQSALQSDLGGRSQLRHGSLVSCRRACASSPVSGRAGFYGPKGNGAYGGYTLPAAMNTKTEINSEPVRLTFDASKRCKGAKYSHFVDALGLPYRYLEEQVSGFDGSNPAPTLASASTCPG